MEPFGFLSTFGREEGDKDESRRAIDPSWWAVTNSTMPIWPAPTTWDILCTYTKLENCKQSSLKTICGKKQTNW